MIYDYTAFSQNANSKKQVGNQRDQWDDRSTRLMLSGRFGPESYQMHYYASYEFNGFDAPRKSWDFADLSITLPAGKLGALTLGRTKEPLAAKPPAVF